MAKPEWGTKRVCQSCAARFYDLGRSPIVCPNCGATFDLEVLNRSRRARPSPRAAAVADDEEEVLGTDDSEDAAGAEADVEELGDDAEAEEDDAAAEGDDDGQEEDDSLIEDASELGEDEDMSDVIEGGLDEEDPQR